MEHRVTFVFRYAGAIVVDGDLHPVVRADRGQLNPGGSPVPDGVGDEFGDDRLGLVVPARTQGGSRRYSLRHVKQLREVASLSAEGMSLPAISRLIELENTVRSLRAQVRDLEGRLRDEVESRSRVFAAGASGSVVTLRHGTRVRRATEVVVWRPPADD